MTAIDISLRVDNGHGLRPRDVEWVRQGIVPPQVLSEPIEAPETVPDTRQIRATTAKKSAAAIETAKICVASTLAAAGMICIAVGGVETGSEHALVVTGLGAMTASGFVLYDALRAPR